MDQYDDINARLENLESKVKEMNQILQNSHNNIEEQEVANDSLLRYKPSKHHKAYRADKKNKKRCYSR